MNTVTLGTSGLEVSPVPFGTWQPSGDWGQSDVDQAIAAIRFAREQVRSSIGRSRREC